MYAELDNTILVSIIVPVYNVAQYLEECLNSVLSQTLKNYEVICVNDGSTDESLNILKKIAGKDSRLIVLSQTNHGLSHSRNEGLKQARGKYVFYLDSDDYISPNALSLLVEEIEKKNLELLLFNATVFCDDGVDEKRLQADLKIFSRVSEYPLVYKGEELFKILLENKEYIPTVFLQFAKRDFLIQNELYFCEKIIHEDELYTFQCMLKAIKVGYLNQRLYFRRVRNNSIMTSLKNPEKLAFSVYSCFFCFKEMLFFYNSIEIQNGNKIAIEGKIKEIISASRQRYAMLDESTKSKIWAYVSNDEKFFSLLVENFCLIKQKIKGNKDLPRILEKMDLKNTKREERLQQLQGLKWNVALSEQNKVEQLKKIEETLQKEMKEQIKISVIIPVYNTELYLPDCLDSVIIQSMKEIEIICIDDASQDNSRYILETYAKKDTRIKLVFHDHNMGTSSARKHGVEIASGKYIMFLDSDDEYTVDACETAFNAIEKNQTDIVKFGVEVINNSDEGLKKFFRTKRVSSQYGESLLHLWVAGKIQTSWNCWNKVYEAALCKKAFNEIEDKFFFIAEDLYFSFVYGYYAKSYSEIEDTLYIYRRGVGNYAKLKNSGLNLNQFKSILNEKDVFDAIENFIQQKPDKDNFQPMVQKIYDYLLNENVGLWSNKLREEDKVKGFELLIKTWLSDNIFCAKKLSDAWRNNYGKIDTNLQKYITARLDIKNFGTAGNTIEVIEISDKTTKVQSPGWFKNAQGQGIVIQSSQGDLRLNIKCNSNGSLEIALRGMDCRDKNNNRFPVWIDYKKLIVNGEEIFASSHVVWHDKPYRHRFNVVDGEMVAIDVEWKAVDNTSEFLP